jgi:hypothetical protein
MLLHHLSNLLLNHSKQDKWLVLIRLLAVGGISGTLLISPSASPYKQKPLGSEDEARRYIKLMNYGQRSYYNKHGKFAYVLADLNTVLPIQIHRKTQHYQYRVYPSFSFWLVTNQARPLPSRQDLPAVIGGVNILGERKVCIATLPPFKGGPKGIENFPLSSPLSCPPGYQDMGEK